MQWFKRLPGFTRSAPGLEWSIWKRLPALLFWATALPLGAGAAAWVAAPGVPGGAEDAALMLTIYQLVGLAVLLWTLVLTLAIGCAVVIVMKGPAFVADAYPPPGRDAPL